MKINYWECKYRDYDYYTITDEDGFEDDQPIYGCSHPKRKFDICEPENKYHLEDECELLDESQSEN